MRRRAAEGGGGAYAGADAAVVGDDVDAGEIWRLEREFDGAAVALPRVGLELFALDGGGLGGDVGGFVWFSPLASIHSARNINETFCSTSLSSN